MNHILIIGGVGAALYLFATRTAEGRALVERVRAAVAPAAGCGCGCSGASSSASSASSAASSAAAALAAELDAAEPALEEPGDVPQVELVQRTAARLAGGCA